MPHSAFAGVAAPFARTPAIGTLISKSALLVTPTLNVGFGTSRGSVRIVPATWCMKLTRSVSYWKWPASTVYGTFDLVGRSVLKLRIWSGGAGLKSQY